jgi:hypothetical protein
MRQRIQQELVLLKDRYCGLRHAELLGEDWFLLPQYPFPPGWQEGSTIVRDTAVAFSVNASYPIGEPYAFLIPTGLTFGGAPPGNAGAARPCPFVGQWMQLSWGPADWRPTDSVETGSNLLVWARSFAARLREGA